jgi:DNA-binding NarL/FixJ family response regulator
MAEYALDVLETGADSIIAAGKTPEALSEAQALLAHCKRLREDAARAEAKLEDMLAEGCYLHEVFGVVAEDARALLARALDGESVRLIAHAIGSTPSTVKGWQRGDHLPQLPHMISLALLNPEIGDAVRRWLAIKVKS